ncbi:hybrid sensor histidine kinase/response regulator [Pyxidicoccus sp. MSG2]|uniref:hybrid sensor histidine kinase/response regulator n=1 Tax=Pyxidicoccus sp. MSG2 TaxID=2996790 RepID=UPI00226F3D60|nr:hybrid sensor histidine kinase/response regulator [Pyxidicoccus sp. MSG2]MCY1015705.1 hybrid sensor histidine kinase/response regulator [Pyxidicoccus sp. MSG2]
MSAAVDVRGVTSPGASPAVLLVEDSAADAIALQRALQPLGVALVCVTSGEEAVQAVERQDFVAVLLDVYLAGTWDGFETARRIRETPGHQAVPLLFMTGSVEDALLPARAYRAGAVDFLHKPLFAEQLTAKVSVFLELWQARERERCDLRAREAHALRRAEAERQRVDALNATLVAHQEWLQSVLQRLPVPLILVERDTARILFANTRADEYWGATFPRAMSEDDYARAFALVDLTGRELAPSEYPAVRAAHGENITGLQLLARTPRGQRAVLVDTAQVPALGERPACAVVTFQDITPLKEAELALRKREVDNARLYQASQQAVRLRDEFLSVASHELRTPLTPIRIKVQALQRQTQAAAGGVLPADKVASVLDTVSTQTRRLGRLVDALLDVSQFSAGRLEIHREPVDLAGLLHEVAASFEADCAKAGCRLDLHAPGTVVGAYDRQRMEQVVSHLLANAVKYGAGRPIHLRLEADGGSARLTVRDEGIGISPEALPRLFGKFERAVSERHYGGLGLGLYLAREIVEAHGGTIRVESQPGLGACFEVALPLGPILG